MKKLLSAALFLVSLITPETLKKNSLFNRLLKTTTLILILSVFSNAAHSQTTYYDNYAFRIPLTLNNASLGISTDQTNFVALLKVTSPDFVSAVCSDQTGGLSSSIPVFAIIDSAYSTTSELNYQVENYNTTTGVIYFWVKIPTLYHAAVNKLYCYFGSTSPSVTHDTNWQKLTWSNVTATAGINYSGVWHFNESPSGAAPQFSDATVNDNNLSVGDEGTVTQNTASQIGNGITLAATSVLDIGATNMPNSQASQSLSMWASYPTIATGITAENLIVLENSTNPSTTGNGTQLGILISSNALQTWRWAQRNTPLVQHTPPPTVNVWHYYSYTYNATTKVSNLYVDGALVGGPTTDTSNPPFSGTVDMVAFGDYINNNIGGSGLHTVGGQSFTGTMDETHIIGATLAADWVKAEYVNQYNPDAFTTAGAMQTNSVRASAVAGYLVYTWKGVNTNITNANNWNNTTSGAVNEAPVNSNVNWVIPSGLTNYPVLTASAGVYGLTIAQGAYVNLNGQTLSVGCNIYNNATTAGTGILNAGNNASGITWDGSLSTQTYTGTNNPTTAEVGNMTVNNSSAGTITITGGPVDLFNLLTLTTGNLVINNAGNGALTLKSTAAQTAAVGIIPSTCSIQGLVNAERFLTGGGLFSNRGYRMLSSPVNQTQYLAATTNTISLYYLNKHTYYGSTYAGAFTAGPGGTSGGFSIYNFVPTMYLYKEPLAFSNASFTGGDHVGIDDINATGSGTTGTVTTTETLSDGTTVNIPVGNGFIMYFVGSTATRTNATTATAPDDATMTANGYLNQGSIPVSLWYTPSGGAGKLSYTTPDATHPYPGFNMVGNPYPSTINLAQVITDNSASIDAIYVLSAKDSPNQLYIAYTANGASAPNENYAVSGEGFIVRATAAGNKTLTFQESEKIPTGQLTGSALIMALRKPQATTPGGNLSEGPNSLAAIEPQGNTLTGLYMKMQKDTNTYNYCGIYFRKDWLVKYAEDDAQDINGTSSPVVMASLTSDGVLASVNHMPDYTSGINVKLYVNANADGLYNLSIEGIRNIDTLYDIYLVDNYKKDSLDIRRYGTYAFNISKSDTSSFGGGRFELSIHPGPLPLYKLLSFTGQKVTGGVQVNWRTEAEGNYTGFVLQKLDVIPGQYDPLYSLQGNSSGAYSFTDPNPISGSNTYRLQQSDIANNISYSSPITIIYSQSGLGGAFSVYPNPAVATISVNVGNVTSGTPTYKANIYNSVGELMSQKTVSGSNWTQDVTLYKPGVYIIQLIDSNGNLVGKSKFVKTN